MRDYQAEVDISACFNAIDAMFAICSCETEEEAQGKYTWTLEYAAPDAASKHRAELARGLGLPMTTEPQKTKAKKKVKPMLLKIGNGFGQNGETLVHKGLDYGMYELPQGLVKEILGIGFLVVAGWLAARSESHIFSMDTENVTSGCQA